MFFISTVIHRRFVTKFLLRPLKFISKMFSTFTLSVIHFIVYKVCTRNLGSQSKTRIDNGNCVTFARVEDRCLRKKGVDREGVAKWAEKEIN